MLIVDRRLWSALFDGSLRLAVDAFGGGTWCIGKTKSVSEPRIVALSSRSLALRSQSVFSFGKRGGSSNERQKHTASPLILLFLPSSFINVGPGHVSLR